MTKAFIILALNSKIVTIIIIKIIEILSVETNMNWVLIIAFNDLSHSNLTTNVRRKN